MIHPHVLTTSRESAEKKGRSAWLGFLPAKNCLDRSSLYVFTDGSSKGSYAAVYVRGADPSVVFEEHAPKGSKLVVVSDLLWLGATVVGARKASHPEIAESLRLAKQTIEQRGLDVRFVHHGGHQEDDSDFTRWNARADELCKQKAKAST